MHARARTQRSGPRPRVCLMDHDEYDYEDDVDAKRTRLRLLIVRRVAFRDLFQTSELGGV